MSKKIKEKLINETKLIQEVKKHYGKFHLEWIRQNPVWKPRIPDHIVALKRSSLPNPLLTPKAGVIEFKCENDFLTSYTINNGLKPKMRSDSREEQLLFVKNLFSNSCIINYNNKVQQIEEYVWVYEDSKGNTFIPFRDGDFSAKEDINLTPRLVKLSCCTLQNIKILSIENMLEQIKPEK